MSDYYGAATLEDWLSEEVFDGKVVPAKVVAVFEPWRESVENTIQAWMDSDEGDGRASWRGWGRGFYAIPDSEYPLFKFAVNSGRDFLVNEK